MAVENPEDISPRENTSSEGKQNLFRILRKEMKGDSGFIVVEILGNKHYIEVKRDRKKVILSLGARKGIPLSSVELLLEQDQFAGLDRGTKSKVLKEIKANVYELINATLPSPVIFRNSFLNAKVYFYEDGLVRIYYKGRKYAETTVGDEEDLKLKLLDVAREEGLDDVKAAEEVRKFLEEVVASIKPFTTKVVIGDTEIRYADGRRMKAALVEGSEAYFTIWVWGEFTNEEDVRVVGAKPIFFKSDGAVAEVVESVPAAAPAEVIFLPLELIRNCVLTVNEFNELWKEVGRINKGEAEPPTWRGVFEAIMSKIREYVGAEEIIYKVASLFIIYTYFYDLINHATYTIPVGESGSGKRNLSTFIGALTRSYTVTDPSEASLARIINTIGGVAIIDETIIDEFMRRFLNAGSQKNTPITRCNKDDPTKIEVIDPFGPKVIVCQPKDLAELPQDTRNRSIPLSMVRWKGVFKREVERGEVWSIIKDLYLLMLYRWGEFKKTYEELDPVVSKIFGGHDRDKWLIILTVAYLVGEDVFKDVLTYAVGEYRKREGVSEDVQYVINGILRALSTYLVSIEFKDDWGLLKSGGGDKRSDEFKLVEKIVEEVNGSELLDKSLFALTAKGVIVANEGEYDTEIHRSLATKIGKILRKGELPFVVDFDREGKERKRLFKVDINKLTTYINNYELEVPADLDFALIKKHLKIDLESLVFDPEKILKSVLQNGKSVRSVQSVRHEPHEFVSKERLNDKENVKTTQADTSDTLDTSKGSGETISTVSVSVVRPQDVYRFLVSKFNGSCLSYDEVVGSVAKEFNVGREEASRAVDDCVELGLVDRVEEGGVVKLCIQD
ncbi:MAG: hypothetical protein B7O98_02735 [Zestosphaera tikiterensis]|uniref:Uncharacterized protein n=1 Tax=Zestosphaera tikiterensis TaxID=1973259 RepID=A0A2R7Y755_9CREN|nr:MAG: hypothetical protein B7O98_02735 [Zestosphaera tikiterensis]